jgi:hypothetical protein
VTTTGLVVGSLLGAVLAVGAVAAVVVWWTSREIEK